MDQQQDHHHQQQDQHQHQHQRRPNAELTVEERRARVQLKKLFREQQRRRKLDVRLRKAELRGDVAVVDQTRRELAELLSLEQPSPELQQQQPMATAATYHPTKKDSQEEAAAASFIENVYREMQKEWRDSCEEGTSGATTSSGSSTSTTTSSTDNQTNQQHPLDRDSINSTTNNNNNKYKNKIDNNPQYTPRHVKEQRLQEARRLLQSMSQGQQTLADFGNPAALRGYARQKFVERAMLVVRSLLRLRQLATTTTPTTTTPIVATTFDPQQQHQQYEHSGDTAAADDVDASVIVGSAIATAMLECLGKVRSVCSVGCGPGCETVGVVAFLQSQQHQPCTTTTTTTTNFENNKIVLLDRILFSDWAMSDWRPMLESVKQCLVQHPQCVVRQVDMATCDVRVSIWDPTNTTPTESSAQDHEQDANESANLLQMMTSSSIASIADPSLPKQQQRQLLLSYQLIVVSYLFSETRGKWHALFDDLVDLAPAGTLFLLTDPTAWQLHLFRERYEFFDHHGPKRMEFCWLDSSMHRPELQALESRLNAAVLLAMVVASSSSSLRSKNGATAVPTLPEAGIKS